MIFKKKMVESSKESIPLKPKKKWDAKKKTNHFFASQIPYLFVPKDKESIPPLSLFPKSSLFIPATAQPTRHPIVRRIQLRSWRPTFHPAAWRPTRTLGEGWVSGLGQGRVVWKKRVFYKGRKFQKKSSTLGKMRPQNHVKCKMSAWIGGCFLWGDVFFIVVFFGATCCTLKKQKIQV